MTLLNLFGTNLIEDVVLDDITEDGAQVRQNSSTAGTLTFRRLNVQDHVAGFGESGIEVQTDLASNFTMLVDDSDFAINTNAIMGVAMSTAATHTGTLTVTVNNSDFNGLTSFGSGAIQALGGGSGTANHNVTGNRIINDHFDGIRINNDDTQITNARVLNNTITGTGAGGVPPGAPVNNGEGITMRQDQNGSMRALIEGNTVTGFMSNGIHLASQDNTVDNNQSTMELSATVRNNNATSHRRASGPGYSSTLASAMESVGTTPA